MIGLAVVSSFNVTEASIVFVVISVVASSIGNTLIALPVVSSFDKEEPSIEGVAVSVVKACFEDLNESIDVKVYDEA